MTTFRHVRFVAAVLAAVLADAVSKAAAVRWLTDNAIHAGVFDLRVTRNTGVAFSLGADQPLALIVGLTGLAVIALAVAGWRGRLGPAVPAGLIVGGGIANLGDRIIGGSVIDIFDLGWWPVFNLADVFLTTGVGMLLVWSMLDGGPDDRPGEPADAGSRARPAAAPHD